MSTIVTRAGKGAPLTHNEVDANFTNLNADKYEAGDSPTFANVTVTGTVDGRDVSVDGAKLDGIEAGADVTDTANVTAAGALMDSELTDIAAVKALNQGVATTDSPTFAGLNVVTSGTTAAYLKSTTANVQLAMSDTGGSTLLRNTGGNMVFRIAGDADTAGTNTSEGMRLTATGLGIGTTSPATSLHVASNGTIRSSGSTSGYADFSVSNSLGGAKIEGSNGTNANAFIDFEAPDISAAGGDVTYRFGRLTTEGTSDLSRIVMHNHDGTSGTAAWIGSDGNGYFATSLGIGTTSPSAKLDVVGSTELNGATTVGGTFQTYGGLVRLHDSTGDGVKAVIGRYTTDQPYAYWTVAGSDTRMETGVAYGKELRYTGSGNINFNNGGSVGIGTTSPSAKLDVVGNAEINGRIDATLDFSNRKPGTFWSTTSYFGVGTLGNLTTQGSYSTDLTSNGYRNSSGTWTGFASNGYTGASQIQLRPTGVIYFGTEASKADGSSASVAVRMTLNDTGLGIGTTSPSEKLHVVGNMKLTGWVDGYLKAHFETYALAEAATIPSFVEHLTVGGLDYVRDATGTALSTNSGSVNWSPSPDRPAMVAHWGVTGTTHGANEGAVTSDVYMATPSTDNYTELEAAFVWCLTNGRNLHGDPTKVYGSSGRLVWGPRATLLDVPDGTTLYDFNIAALAHATNWWAGDQTSTDENAWNFGQELLLIGKSTDLIGGCGVRAERIRADGRRIARISVAVRGVHRQLLVNVFGERGVEAECVIGYKGDCSAGTFLNAVGFGSDNTATVFVDFKTRHFAFNENSSGVWGTDDGTGHYGLTGRTSRGMVVHGADSHFISCDTSTGIHSLVLRHSYNMIFTGCRPWNGATRTNATTHTLKIARSAFNYVFGNCQIADGGVSIKSFEGQWTNNTFKQFVATNQIQFIATDANETAAKLIWVGNAHDDDNALLSTLGSGTWGEFEGTISANGKDDGTSFSIDGHVEQRLNGGWQLESDNTMNLTGDFNITGGAARIASTDATSAYGVLYLGGASATAKAQIRSTTAGAIAFWNAASGTPTQKAIIDTSGNFGIGRTPNYKMDVNGSLCINPGSSVTPFAIGDVVFELTNNTTLTFKAKGSDGVVRSATLTLS